MEEVRLSSPWEAHTKMLRALLRGDERVKSITYDDEKKAIVIMVHGNDKAESLQRILISHLEFGNVYVEVQVIPDNEESTEADDFETALDGNPLFCGIHKSTLPAGDEASFALFSPDTIQFFADNAGSPYGLETMTVEEAARRAFVQKDVRVSSQAKF